MRERVVMFKTYTIPDSGSPFPHVLFPYLMVRNLKLWYPVMYGCVPLARMISSFQRAGARGQQTHIVWSLTNALVDLFDVATY